MAKIHSLIMALLLASASAAHVDVQGLGGPETVVVPSGTLNLRGLLWRPRGRGPFPAILFNHGSGRGKATSSGSRDERNRARQPAVLGPVFASHGYAFLFLFRRGTVLSADQGAYSGDLMERELTEHGEDARNQVQLRLLETDEINDALAGIAFLQALPDVDARRVAVVGHSFGGSLVLLMAERETTLRAIVDFAGAASGWPRSPQLRARLLVAVGRAVAPVFFIQAANDYSVAPSEVLAAEMARLGKPHRVKIYPPVGRTADEGHSFVYLSVATWEPDVFAFLDERMR